MSPAATHMTSIAATTGIGSLPHHNVDAALAFSMRHAIPFLPQIPIRNPWEFMIAQALEDLPGLGVERDGELWLNAEIWAGRASQLDARLERALGTGAPGAGASGSEATSEFEPSAAVSSGWQAFLWELGESGRKQAKIQIAGPMTCQWALRLRGGGSIEKHPHLSTQVLRLVLARALAMSRRLQSSGIEPILFLDEPGLYAYSASNPRHVLAFQELKLLVRTLRKEGVSVGLHLLQQRPGKAVRAFRFLNLSLDTALLEGVLQEAGGELAAFLERGGRLSLGVIPTGRSSAVHSLLSAAGPEALVALFEDLRAKLRGAFGESQGPDPRTRKTLREALYTPACGLALQSIADAELIAEALERFSHCVRRSYEE